MTPDERLEHEISVEVLKFQTAKTISERRKAWNAFKVLQAKRSPEQVEKLEREKGLRT